jgi:sugar/nucleoside kinase (ribokinase family)
MATIVDVEKVRPGVADLLRSIDALIAAAGFPTEYTGYADLGRALRALAREFSAPLVAVTLGPEGSLALCGDREIRTPAFKVEVVDSTGAGDAFRGGFAGACLRMPDGTIEDVLAYANAVAALNCRALGARGGMPTHAEVIDLLTRRLAV